MPAIDLDSFTQRHSRALDWLTGVFVTAGIVALFFIDVSEPRGVVDGIGYAALVALSVRFGKSAIVTCAFVTTTLTLMAAFMLPNSGVSVADMWANRGFAFMEIWIVAIILLRLLDLQQFVARREKRAEIHQAALATIIREALVPDIPLVERAQLITETAAEAIGADMAAILQGRQNGQFNAVVDFWDRRHRRHMQLPDQPRNLTEEFRQTIRRDFIAYADDIADSPAFNSQLDTLLPLGVRALLIGDTFVEDRSSGRIAVAFSEPHAWTLQETTFCRSVANLVALVFAASRMAETLATIEQVGEGIYATGPDGSVLYANHAARELVGASASGPFEGLPQSPDPLTAEDDLHEIHYRGRDLEIQRRRLFNGGIVTRIADVTERNAAFAERKRLEARLDQAARMEAIGQLAGGVAHDFNNILGSILGFAGFLAQDLPQNSAEQGFAERILSACERGKDLVEQMLAFARARTDEQGIVDLDPLLERCRERLRASLPDGIDLRIVLPDGTTLVRGSKSQIERMIMNLCSNASDAIDGNPGRIDISVESASRADMERMRGGTTGANEKTFGQIDPSRDYCLLRVADNGRGMDRDILGHIFEPFFTTKGRHRSSGLGLAVVHGVVEAMRGAGHIVSEPGKGTVFSILLPCATGDSDQPANRSAAPPVARGSERILIVDDERDIADMLAIGLERLGYDTVGVTDPVEALAAFAEDPEAFDVVITDQVMPGMRGLDLIRRMKEIKPAVKTVICSGYSDSVSADVARQAGTDAFFHKPVDARLIAPQIRALMDRN